MREESGFSLVQVLIAAGMMGALALGVMQITQNISQTLSNAQNVQDQMGLFSEIDMLLRNEDHCRVSLGGENFEASSLAFRRSLLNAEQGATLYPVELYFSSEDGKKRRTKKFSAIDSQYKKYGNISIETISLSLENKDTSNYPQKDRHVDQGFIDVEISRPVSVGQNRLIQKSFPVQLTLQTNLSGETRILSCASLDAVAQEKSACENAGRFYLPERNPPCSLTMNKVNELAPLGIAQGNMGLLRCPEGFGVTGLSGSSEKNKINQVKIHCEPIQKEDLTPDHDNPYGSPFVGKPMGSISNSICEKGLWANGLRADILNGIGGIGVNCSGFNDTNQRQARTIGNSSRLGTAVSCQPNTILREVSVYYTDKIEALRGVCW